MVLSEHVPCRMSRRVAVGLGALALLTLPAWSLGGADRPKPTPEKPEAPVEKPVLLSLNTYSDSASPAPDKKVQELEAKIKALLEEVQALRKAKKPTASTTSPKPKAVYSYRPTLLSERSNLYSMTLRPASNEVALSRATYKLSADKAKALAAFLAEHVKASILETKVEGENLIVTTTPQVQQVIRQFIPLVQGKQGNQKSGLYRLRYTPAKP